MAYAERVLQRYRPALYAEQGETLLRRLIEGYPTHGFVLDREELQDLGVSNRLPDATEAPLLEQLALALLEFGTQADLIELVEPPHTPKAGARRLLKPVSTPRRTAAGATGARRGHRLQEGEAA
jgi:hypothetical protein